VAWGFNTREKEVTKGMKREREGKLRRGGFIWRQMERDER